MLDNSGALADRSHPQANAIGALATLQGVDKARERATNLITDGILIKRIHLRRWLWLRGVVRLALAGWDKGWRLEGGWVQAVLRAAALDMIGACGLGKPATRQFKRVVTGRRPDNEMAPIPYPGAHSATTQGRAQDGARYSSARPPSSSPLLHARIRRPQQAQKRKHNAYFAARPRAACAQRGSLAGVYLRHSVTPSNWYFKIARAVRRMCERFAGAAIQ